MAPRAVQPLSVVPVNAAKSNCSDVIANGCSMSGFGKIASASPHAGAAVRRTRPSSWRTAPRWASAMPTVSRRTPGFTVWTRSQPFPVVATSPAAPPAVFVQVRPEAASPAALGAGEPMWLVKAYVSPLPTARAGRRPPWRRSAPASHAKPPAKARPSDGPSARTPSPVFATSPAPVKARGGVTVPASPATETDVPAASANAVPFTRGTGPFSCGRFHFASR